MARGCMGAPRHRVLTAGITAAWAIAPLLLPALMASFAVRAQTPATGQCARPQVEGSAERMREVPPQAPPNRARGAAPGTEAADPLILLVTKSWSGGAWQIDLAWAGSAGPFTVSYSTDPSFQSGAQTLELEYAGVSYQRAEAPASALECFEVTDGSVVSLPAQTLGYDPVPPPATPQFTNQGYWWGDPITFTSTYLDPIAEENIVHFRDRPVRPDAAGGVSGAFATTLTVDEIPDDTRSSWPMVEAAGRTSPYVNDPAVVLLAEGIAFTDVTSITWAPCGSPVGGNVWVAASGGLYEVDLFRRTPTLALRDGAPSRAVLSRPTAANRILYVDGTNGAAEVKQIDPCTGAISTFAQTTDAQFTRALLPRGIAADPSGAYCYIADANLGRVVRIPAGNAEAITDLWGNRAFSFGSRVGMDVGLDGRLYLVETTGRVWQIVSRYNPYSMGYVPAGTVCLDVDRDASTATNTRFYWDSLPLTHAYNRNPIGDVAGTPTRYHGGTVFATAEGALRLDPVWTYSFSRHFPQRVLLSNQGQPVPYPSPYQGADRILEIRVRGWPGVPVRLRLVDPPDLAAYAPEGGFAATYGTPAAPYEANDNLGMADYGLTTDPTGAGAAPTLTVTPASDYYALAYLKVPPNVSGNNLQVEATKCKADGTVLPEKVNGLSPVYTSWKRVFVERDKMFRRGNLMDSDVVAPPAGQLYLRRWDSTTPASEPTMYIQAGDLVAAFDVAYPYPGGSYETAVVSSSPAPGFFDAPRPGGGIKSVLRAYLDDTPTNPYSPSPLTFASGASAAVGVLDSADGLIDDTTSNQLNGPGSAFYDADMRNFQHPFNDACVEFVGMASGMGATPYLPQSWFDSADPLALPRFSQIWFCNKAPWPSPNQHLNYSQNYMHALGASSLSAGAGASSPDCDFSFIFRQLIQTGCSGCSPAELDNCTQETTIHELAHQFRIDSCDFDYHDGNMAWCGNMGGNCTNPTLGFEYCVMHREDPSYWGMRKDGISRFDCDDLATTGVQCGIPSCSQGTSIRTDFDPE